MGNDREYGKVTTERGSIGEEEPVVLFRAQDKLLPALLDHYWTLCFSEGVDNDHLDAIQATLDNVEAWQAINKVKVPDTDLADYR